MRQEKSVGGCSGLVTSTSSRGTPKGVIEGRHRRASSKGVGGEGVNSEDSSASDSASYCGVLRIECLFVHLEWPSAAPGTGETDSLSSQDAC